ncbi:MAG TPA: dipeptide ABC transporter ATP-binding protein [Vicinamibacteria bacterium]|nr:dipeptide ABC transporter ATP-binding protein [Vicinamibacteria bacterium]
MKAPLVQVRDLRKHYPVKRGLLRRQVATIAAVDGLTFDIAEGETLGLVGESGCGKSTTARALLHLVAPTGGEVRFQGTLLSALSPRSLRRARRDMQMIFQDPYASLDPRLKVAAIVGEPLEVHALGDRESRRARVQELLALVGLRPEHASRYPHQFSGGQRQRIGIARALATSPRFVVADEPISALDVSIQAQVVNLLDDLKHQLGLTYLFIAHDLAMVRHISDRVAVMYLGRIVELGSRDDIFERPLHPYTRALLSAIPIPDPALEARRARVVLEGDVPSPAHPPAGCRFHPRCPLATDICTREDPETRDLGTTGNPHRVACHHAEAS